MTPTFLIWSIDNQGILIRAYHQTILASKMKNNNLITNGINEVTLDEYFSRVIKNFKYLTVNNFNEIMIFALCDWSHNSQIPNGLSKDNAIEETFK